MPRKQISTPGSQAHKGRGAISNIAGRFVQLDCSLFRKPLSVPAAKKPDGQLDIFG
jgi:hypothetical protein